MDNIASSTGVNQKIPFAIMKNLRRFSRPFSDELTARIRSRLEELAGTTFTQDDMNRCIAEAFANISVRQRTDTDFARPNINLMNEALADYQAGRTRPLQEYLDELRRATAESSGEAT